MAFEVKQTRVRDILDLSGKVVVVTVSHAWLGFDMVSALAEFGGAIAITSRTLAQAEGTTSQIGNEYSVDTLALELDQYDYSSVKAMAKATLAWKGRVNILINNAGGVAQAPAKAIDLNGRLRTLPR